MTLRTPVLNQAQIDDFHKNGFVVVRQAFNPEEVAKVESWVNEMVARPEEPGKHWVFWEESKKEPGKKIICRMERFCQFHPGFKELAEALRKPTSQLLGEEAVLFKEKLNFKYPGAEGFDPHQDSQAGWEKYAPFFISVMFCIDEATMENGCLKMVSGFHKNGLYRSWEPLNNEDMKGMDFVPAPSKPGDIVFFDSYAPHSSDPNMSNKTRRLYFATYNRMSQGGDMMEQYYADKHKTFPPDIERVAGKNYKYKV